MTKQRLHSLIRSAQTRLDLLSSSYAEATTRTKRNYYQTNIMWCCWELRKYNLWLALLIQEENPDA